jgi:hypothetical protein
MLLVAALLVGHLSDGVGRAPFVQGGALLGGGTAAGLVFHESGAWQRACEEASGGAPIGYFRGANDRVLAATQNGLIFTDDRGCTWQPVDGVLRNLEVTAIRAAFSAPHIVYLTTGTAGQPNSVWKSEDGGASFVETALVGVIHPLFDVVTSDDGSVVVVTGFDLDDNAPLVRASTDGGLSFVPIADPGFVVAAFDRVRALAVDDRIWLSLLQGTDAFVASADFALADVVVEDQLPGEVLALAPFQGARYALARPGALHRQSASGESFAIVQGVDALCLERGDDSAHLWACGTPGSGVQFLASTDGAQFEPALLTNEIVDRVCPEGTPAATVCAALAPVDAGPSEPDAGPAQTDDAGSPDAGFHDAGVTDAGSPDGGGHEDDGGLDDDKADDDDDACASQPGSTAPVGLGALALAAWRSRRRSALDGAARGS